MCVIAIKPSGVKMPDSALIRQMWERNPDGAGVMYAHAGIVHIDKGYMTQDAYSKHLKNLAKKLDLTQTTVVMHFRITTHGGTKPENCHPFPLSGKIADLQRLHTTARIGVAHNGIIPIQPRQGVSDTMEYIATQLAPLYAMKHDFYRDSNALELIRNAIHSKMVFLTGGGKFTLVGDFTERGGIWYSNLNHTYTAPKFSAVQTAVKPTSKSTRAGKSVSLMPCDNLADGAFAWFVSSNETSDDLEDLLIDRSGRVYSYAPEDNLCYPDPQIRVYDAMCRPAKYEDRYANPETVAYTYEDLYSNSRAAI